MMQNSRTNRLARMLRVPRTMRSKRTMRSAENLLAKARKSVTLPVANWCQRATLSRAVVKTTTMSKMFQNLSRERKNCKRSATACRTKLTMKKTQKRSATTLRRASPLAVPGSSTPELTPRARHSVSRTTKMALRVMTTASTTSYVALPVHRSSTDWLASNIAALRFASGVRLRAGLLHLRPLVRCSHRLCCGVFSGLPKALLNLVGMLVGRAFDSFDPWGLLAKLEQLLVHARTWPWPLFTKLRQLLDAALTHSCLLGEPST
mmetsp:Transcript_128598/g.358001  ORF Transcript_128598/g.358001 Transcript_128598/m.358001 type:complete len:263 (-) Transcript_128598:125-913(-)